MQSAVDGDGEVSSGDVDGVCADEGCKSCRCLKAGEFSRGIAAVGNEGKSEVCVSEADSGLCGGAPIESSEGADVVSLSTIGGFTVACFLASPDTLPHDP